jgi:hypothetical protein
MTVTNQKNIHEETASRLKSEIAFHPSVRNVWSSRLLSKNVKIKIYKTIILVVVLCGCETWFLTLKQEHTY